MILQILLLHERFDEIHDDEGHSIIDNMYEKDEYIMSDDIFDEVCLDPDDDEHDDHDVILIQ